MSPTLGLPFVTAALVAGSPFGARAAPTVEEPFRTGAPDYALGTLAGQGPAATGFAGNWLLAYTGAESPVVLAAGLSYSDGTNGLAATGGAVAYAGAGNGRVGRLLTQPLTDAAVGTVYLGVLIKLEATTAGYRGFELHNGGFDDGTQRTLQIVTGEPGVGASDTNVVLRINNDPNFVADLGAPETGTNLFVIRIDFGSATGADTLTLWRNPEDLMSEANSTPDADLDGFDLRIDRASLARFGDGGLTFDEVRIGTQWSDVTTVVDPADTDNDGMLDAYERANGLDVGTNDAGGDLDMDGSPNLEEHDRNTRANVFDTDTDGIRDGWERGNGFVSAMETGTDPLVSDTDGDGLRDGDETNSRMAETPPLVGTSPLLADTDMDSESDAVEVREGTDPLDGADSSAARNLAIVDGIRDTLYGEALAIQTVETGFGDNQSEWNAAYAHLSVDHLFLLFTGNLEGNFNKLEIFIDSAAGGATTFASADNDGSGAMNGMTFDTGFTPEIHLIARRSGGTFDLDFADLTESLFDQYLAVFPGSGIGTTGTGFANGAPIRAAYDGSNLAGIGGTAGAAADAVAALAVTTGLELRIALTDLGSPAGPIRVMLLQNSNDHTFLSNQALGGLPVGTGNLANPATIDFRTFEGDQFFTVPPPPVDAFRIVDVVPDILLEELAFEVRGLVAGRGYHAQRSTDLRVWTFIPGTAFTADAPARRLQVPADVEVDRNFYLRISEGGGQP